ncbi:hypothetical protein T12_14832 [Trichinella patagoniensis]|uniref:Uncharacterized protein n=1 Tax=Trichinella patagoniensis TaxID=990121 RepID=A0A0V0ZSM6_9BILA|nr:hypothetical protein T12_14832 [Trichinella patagoniensis]
MDRMVGYCPGQLGSCEMAVGRLLAPTPYGGSSNQCKRSALAGHSDQVTCTCVTCFLKSKAFKTKKKNRSTEFLFFYAPLL